MYSDDKGFLAASHKPTREFLNRWQGQVSLPYHVLGRGETFMYPRKAPSKSVSNNC